MSLPSVITDALANAKTDGVAIAGIVLGVIVAIAAFKYIRHYGDIELMDDDGNVTYLSKEEAEEMYQEYLAENDSCDEDDEDN